MKLYESRADMRPSSASAGRRTSHARPAGGPGVPPRLDGQDNRRRPRRRAISPWSVLGHARTDEWKSGVITTGVWFSTIEDAPRTKAPYVACRTANTRRWPSPLVAGRIADPDIALFYATPGAMIYFINGLQWAGQAFRLGRGRRAPAPIPGARADEARAVSLHSVLRRARRYGGVLDDGC